MFDIFPHSQVLYNAELANVLVDAFAVADIETLSRADSKKEERARFCQLLKGNQQHHVFCRK